MSSGGDTLVMVLVVLVVVWWDVGCDGGEVMSRGGGALDAQL